MVKTKAILMAGLVLSGHVLFGACYVNSESHLPYPSEKCITSAIRGTYICSNSAANPTPVCWTAVGGERACFTYFPSKVGALATCGPNSKNADLKWNPDQVTRRALFDTVEVQNTSSGCESYGHLLKAECNPEFPVVTIFYDPNGNYKIETLVVQRDPFLNSSNNLSPGIKNYIQARLRIPSGNWSSNSFLQTIVIPTPTGVGSMNIIQYVEMMNVLFNKYPTQDYLKAYTDFINGDSRYLSFYLASYDVYKATIPKVLLPIINSILLDK